MKNRRLVPALALILLAACNGPTTPGGDASTGANPLVGTWRYNNATAGGTPLITTLTLSASGTGTETIMGTGTPCTGTLTLTGLVWTSTATSITFTGTPMCSGMIVCMMGGTTVNYDCSMNGPFPGTPCDYTLSSANAMLSTNSCSNIDRGGMANWTRM